MLCFVNNIFYSPQMCLLKNTCTDFTMKNHLKKKKTKLLF